MSTTTDREGFEERFDKMFPKFTEIEISVQPPLRQLAAKQHNNKLEMMKELFRGELKEEHQRTLKEARENVDTFLGELTAVEIESGGVYNCQEAKNAVKEVLRRLHAAAALEAIEKDNGHN